MKPARVKAIRRVLGLTQRQLSQQLGVHLVTVKKWETGAYAIGRQAAVRLWLLEQEALGALAGDGRALVDALAHPDGGGVIGMIRGGDAVSSLMLDCHERYYRRIDCPGRQPGVVFAFEDLEPEEFEAARLLLLERALASDSAAREALGGESEARAEPRPRLDAWVRPDWLQRDGRRS